MEVVGERVGALWRVEGMIREGRGRTPPACLDWLAVGQNTVLRYKCNMHRVSFYVVRMLRV